MRDFLNLLEDQKVNGVQVVRLPFYGKRRGSLRVGSLSCQPIVLQYYAARAKQICRRDNFGGKWARAGDPPGDLRCGRVETLHSDWLLASDPRESDPPANPSFALKEGP